MPRARNRVPPVIKMKHTEINSPEGEIENETQEEMKAKEIEKEEKKAKKTNKKSKNLLAETLGKIPFFEK